MLLKKILIITYYWPPYAGSGVQRWLKFSKYLPDFGFKPYVYTPENPHFNIKDENLMDDIHPDVTVVKRPIWEPYSLADFISGKKAGNQGLVANKRSGLRPRILNHIRANYFIPDPRKFWISPSVKFLKKYIKEQNIEYLITTGPPHSMHLIGKGIKKEFPQIKWVVDIRDPWSKFDFLKNFGSSESSLKKQASLETSVFEQCDKVIATSFQMKDLLMPIDENKFECITNGYDQEDFKDYIPDNQSDNIVIYHAGLLNKVRNPSYLWKALDTICRANEMLRNSIKIQLVGVVDQDVISEIQSYSSLKDCLILEAYKKHSDVIEDYTKASILLLLVNNTDNAVANIPGKLFEYIATGKKILCFSDRDTDASRIVNPIEMARTISYEDKLENIEALKSFLLEDNKGSMESDEFKMQYERKNLTSKLVTLLLQL